MYSNCVDEEQRVTATPNRRLRYVRVMVVWAESHPRKTVCFAVRLFHIVTFLWNQLPLRRYALN